MTGRRVMWLGAAAAIALVVLFAATGEPSAAIALAQGFSLACVTVWIAVVVDGARRRPELEQAIEERDELARAVAQHRKWLVEAHQACNQLAKRLREERAAR